MFDGNSLRSKVTGMEGQATRGYIAAGGAHCGCLEGAEIDGVGVLPVGPRLLLFSRGSGFCPSLAIVIAETKETKRVHTMRNTSRVFEKKTRGIPRIKNSQGPPGHRKGGVAIG